MIELFVVTFPTRGYSVFMEMDEEFADTSWSKKWKVDPTIRECLSDLSLSGCNNVILSAPLSSWEVGWLSKGPAMSNY